MDGESKRRSDTQEEGGVVASWRANFSLPLRYSQYGTLGTVHFTHW